MTSSPSAVIAGQVRKLRQQLGLNRQQVAERCAQAGAPQLTSAAITNIETGRPTAEGKRRRDVTVEELLVLARVLNASPLLMLFPIGHQEQMEILPGQSFDTFAALRWFTGQRRFPADTFDYPGVEGAPMPGGKPLKLFEKHHDLVHQHYLLSLRTSQAVEEGEDALRALRAEFEAVESDLRDAREDMRTLGLTPPRLGEDLVHVDGVTLEEFAAQVAAAKRISLDEARAQVWAAANRKARGQYVHGQGWRPKPEELEPGVYHEGKFYPLSESGNAEQSDASEEG